MSEHLTPERLQELRANTLKELPWKDFDTIFTHIDQQAETIRRLRAERRVTKGLHTKIDKQAESIQRVRVLANSWMLEQDEAEYTEPELLALDNAAHEIIDALNGGGQE